MEQLEAMYKSEELTNATAEIVVRRARRSLKRSRIYLKMTIEDVRITKETRHPQRRRRYVREVDDARRSIRSLKASQALAKAGRSDKNPYPGRTALAPVRLAASRILSMRR